ncbi:hypothetical protein [Allonocardiopsis opalescens]|uniref:Uncharacterized protein n=1 Tax=Allonocardiopsis opalescens TaxID=1144618 RepID=A0A2T0QFA1_9ACTN|nr:hypothetical protein [Allonocardiopsis opalescens]PRY02592.1 hypothetical protein CLV72_1011195 [Allonocardiopsis opalescens]
MSRFEDMSERRKGPETEKDLPGRAATGSGEQPRPHMIGPSGSPHGSLRSWLLVAVVIAAFVAGGIALIINAWWLFWTAAAIVVLSVPAGKLIGIMEDTVERP